MKIAFWSPMHGTGVTANMLAVSLSVAEQEETRLLLTETEGGNMSNELVSNGLCEQRGYRSDESGIDGVIRYFKSGILTREIMENCSIDLTGRLSLLAGAGREVMDTTDSNHLRKMVGRIFDIAQDYFDWVIIDTLSGYSKASIDTIADADIVVVNLRQNRHMLDALFANEEFLKLNKDKLFYLFGSYDPNSKYNLSNLRRMYRHINQNNSGGLPHCTTFMDAMTDSRTLRYFAAGQVAEEYGEQEFFRALEEVRKKLVLLAKRTGGNTQ